MLVSLNNKLTVALSNLRYTLCPKGCMISINPTQIGYLQFPEWWLDSTFQTKAASPRRVAGNWDMEDNSRRVFWSGYYEASSGDFSNRRLIPLNNYFFYRALNERFLRNRCWKDTDWYTWVIEQIKMGTPIQRYESLEALRARLEFIDHLYDQMYIGLYYPNTPKEQTSGNIFKRLLQRSFFEKPRELGEPWINLGRDGRISIDDGRHRVCVARLAGVKEIYVRVNAIHAEIH